MYPWVCLLSLHIFALESIFYPDKKKYLKGGRGKIDIILKVKVTVMSAQCIATYIFVSGNKEDKGEE